jgi:hypothetical protein
MTTEYKSEIPNLNNTNGVFLVKIQIVKEIHKLAFA